MITKWGVFHVGNSGLWLYELFESKEDAVDRIKEESRLDNLVSRYTILEVYMEDKEKEDD